MAHGVFQSFKNCHTKREEITQKSDHKHGYNIDGKTFQETCFNVIVIFFNVCIYKKMT